MVCGSTVLGSRCIELDMFWVFMVGQRDWNHTLVQERELIQRNAILDC